MQNDHQPTDAAVAVVKWMQGFELVMRHCSRHYWINLIAAVSAHPLHQITDAGFEIQPWRHRDEPRRLNRDFIARGILTTSNHHLITTNPACPLVFARRVTNKRSMEVGQEPNSEGASLVYPCKRLVRHGDVIEDLTKVLRRRILLVLSQHLCQRRVRALEC